MALNFHEAIAGLPVYGAYERLREVEKQSVAARLVERLVEQTEKPGNAPDEYEHLNLGTAVLLVNTPLWSKAFAYCQIACTPPADRNPVQTNAFVEVPKGTKLRALLNSARQNSGKAMRFTDQQILDAHAMHSLQNTDPTSLFYAVCLDVLGYTPLGQFVFDMTEYDAFAARYEQLIQK